MTGCVGPRLLGDGTSVSVGSPAQGLLRRAARLPFDGDGYSVSAEWRRRGASYGADELLDLIVRVGRRVSREFPGAILGVADLSGRSGGALPLHGSHMSGRDVDVHPYSMDGQGRVLLPPQSVMVRFGANGWAQLPAVIAGERLLTAEPRRFDDARNWALVRAFLSDPYVDVQWIFIGSELAQRLLRFASARHEPEPLIAYASQVLRQPNDAQSHDDHFHVRIFCSPDDRVLGCEDRGPSRWLKKQLKYGSPFGRVSAVGESLNARITTRVFAWPGCFSL